MKRALMEYQILGVKTNIPLLLFVMEHPVFAAGDYTTHFLEEQFRPEVLPAGSPQSRKAVAILAALLRDRETPQLNGSPVNHQQGKRWKLQRTDMMRGS